MARIEPIPYDQLPDSAKAQIEEGLGTGMYTTPVPLQIVAYSEIALKSLHDAYTATFGKGLLGPRLVELLRLRSAQAGGCDTCESSRKEGSISEDDVACLTDPDPSVFTPREIAALRFFDLLAFNHTRIDDNTYRDLGEHFSTAEIVELGYLCGNSLGTHRFFHTLGMTSPGEPIYPYDPEGINRSKADAEVAPSPAGR
jgi:alkylhydroperoxidase family enzyme